MSLREAVELAEQRFKAAGLSNARLEARCLVADAAGLPRQEWMSAHPLGALAEKLDGWVKRRIDGEPLSRIMGRRAFRLLELEISPAVLDPRPETEILVDIVLERRDRMVAPRLLDLGTGSGALLLALLDEWPEAIGLGVDCSTEALAIARHNSARLGLESRADFLESDLFERVSGQFGVIVSNPPYIPSSEIPGLDREVREHDPVVALDGGGDGLAFYRRIFADAARHLVPQGLIALEHGAGQAGAVARLAAEAGFSRIEHHRDYSGLQRHLTAIYAP
jgi:release factor glutamine methyltransferase